ncbi:MAG: ABC transporter permease [Treponema sp.]|nr:ABC transporter permease [Treponema sp.]
MNERMKKCLSSDGAMSLFVIILGFLFATILIALVGRNPIGMYKSLFQSMTGLNLNNGKWNPRYIGEWLNYSVPFIFCGFAMAFASRVGLFNVGGEGQYIIGMTIAQLGALYFPQVSFFQVALALLLATVGGAIWGGVVGWFKARFEVSEVVSTIMLNYIALYISRIVTIAIPGANTFKTPNFPATASLKVSFLTKLFNNSNLNAGIFLCIAGILIYYVVMEKTKTGFAMRATGFNKDAARAAGIPVVASIVASMAISGAFAGIGGGVVALGSFRYGRVITGMDNYGFTGMAVALVGNCTAQGTALAGLLFGLLQASQSLMQSNNIPKEITFIIQGLVVVFIALKTGFRLLFAWRLKKSAASKKGGDQ